MFDGIPMTKEEFLEGIRDGAQDIADPNGEFSQMVGEFQEGADQVRQFDGVMADKMLAIVTAFRDLGAYISERAELMTAPAANEDEEQG